MATDLHHNHGSDKGAAFTGLIAGAVLIFVILFGITKWTNSIYANKEGHAEATK
jgi:hypothetical protein